MLTLTWASGDGFGVFVTPSMFALRLIRCAIRGDLIWLKSIPPGVYVNGFLSFVIIAFWTHDGISACGCVCMRRDGIEPFMIGGGGGAELNDTNKKRIAN